MRRAHIDIQYRRITQLAADGAVQLTFAQRQRDVAQGEALALIQPLRLQAAFALQPRGRQAGTMQLPGEVLYRAVNAARVFRHVHRAVQ